jgi:hypothetical protein
MRGLDQPVLKKLDKPNNHSITFSFAAFSALAISFVCDVRADALSVKNRRDLPFPASVRICPLGD